MGGASVVVDVKSLSFCILAHLFAQHMHACVCVCMM